MGINKQLDLQSWLIEMSRDLATAEGWYPRRRKRQIFLIGVVALIAFWGGLAVATIIFRSVIWQVAVALIGPTFLVTFVVIRAASSIT